MKKLINNLKTISSLADAHRAFNLPAPRHPLISLIHGACTGEAPVTGPDPQVLQFYKISFKPKITGRIRYGQGYYDFDEGGLLFAAPGQIIGRVENDGSLVSAYTLLIHPDFLLGYPVLKKIRNYGFFSYDTHEALHLSEEERETILEVFRMIGFELNSRTDDFSHDLIVSQLELLLTYANRFYKRQFATRKQVNHHFLQQLEEILNESFAGNQSLVDGIPTVQVLASRLNMSPGYLSDMLRSLTGQSAQQHIHQKLIERAKEKLSTTSLSVSEIAYELGFGHPQSFNKLFKLKTSLSPLEFKKSFN